MPLTSWVCLGRISKGSAIIIPILALNRSKKLWGDDAFEFKPERWENPPEAISSIPGVWGHILSFLGGPRACIGYRFSLIEYVAALLQTLLATGADRECSQDESTHLRPRARIRIRARGAT